MSPDDDWVTVAPHTPESQAADDWQPLTAAAPSDGPSLEIVPHTGYRSQVNAAFAGKTPLRYTPEQSAKADRIASGLPVGAVGGTLGLPGDIEGLGRLGLNVAGAPVSTQTFLPNSEDVNNMIAGPAQSQTEEGTRMLGGFAGPTAFGKGAALADYLGGKILSHSLGLTTGSGATAITEAAKAGEEGGQRAQLFLDNMRRSDLSRGDVVDTAKDAVEAMRKQRNAEYRQGIGTTIKGDPTVLDFQPIDNAIRDAAKVGQYQGKVTIGGAEKVWKKIEDVVDDWRQSDPNVFHTPEGLDALKQRIGNLGYDEDLKAIAGPGTPGSKIVGKVYNAVKDQIVAQAPGYAKVMKDYSDASEALREIESTLSLKPNASIDTGLRKLQSIMRNNVNSNYGYRAELAKKVDDVSGGKIMPQLAGQALSSATPRGMQGAADAFIGLTAYGTGNAAAIPLLATTSPRLVGEAAYGVGATKRAMSTIPNSTKRILAHAARLRSEAQDNDLWGQ